ncbi:MAG: hypothetical protein IJB29_02335 [Mailhella sp.]|nr:hypothetical protein [Mailhella sp.]
MMSMIFMADPVRKGQFMRRVFLNFPSFPQSRQYAGEAAVLLAERLCVSKGRLSRDIARGIVAEVSMRGVHSCIYLILLKKINGPSSSFFGRRAGLDERNMLYCKNGKKELVLLCPVLVSLSQTR